MEQLIERYSEIPAQQRYLGVIAVVAVLFGLHYTFVFSGQETKIAQLKKTYSENMTLAQEKRNIAQNRVKYEKRVAELQADLDQARAKLPDTSDIAQLLAQLGNTGRQTGLDIQEFQPQKEKDLKDYFEIAIKMKATGTYHEIAMFIDALGKMERIIHVTDLKMGEPKTVNQRVVVNATFQVRTYRFNTKKKKKGKK